MVTFSYRLILPVTLLCFASAIETSAVNSKHHSSDSFLIHLLSTVNKLETRHVLDAKDLETKLQKLENKLQKQEERHVKEIKKLEIKHNEDITELKNERKNGSNKSKGCVIELTSLGAEDPGYGVNGFRGSIVIGGVIQDLRSFPRVPNVPGCRGILLVTLWKPGNTCEVIHSAMFDTHAYHTAAVNLDFYLKSVRPGSVIAGISVDESMERLTAANAALHHLGVKVTGAGTIETWYRSSLAFIATVGKPEDTLAIQLPRKRGPATLKHIIKAN